MHKIDIFLNNPFSDTVKSWGIYDLPTCRRVEERIKSVFTNHQLHRDGGWFGYDKGNPIASFYTVNTRAFAPWQNGNFNIDNMKSRSLVLIKNPNMNYGDLGQRNGLLFYSQMLFVVDVDHGFGAIIRPVIPERQQELRHYYQKALSEIDISTIREWKIR